MSRESDKRLLLEFAEWLECNRSAMRVLTMPQEVDRFLAADAGPEGQDPCPSSCTANCEHHPACQESK